MKIPFRLYALIVLWGPCGWWLLPGVGFAQDDEEPEPPAAVAAPERPAAAADQAGDEMPAAEDPAVQAVFDANPTTPGEMVRAVQILADLDRADLAKPFLEQLMKAQLAPAAASDLVRRFGSSALFKLARDPALAPEGEQFADAVFKLADQYRSDPARLAQLAGQLGNPSQAAREDAMFELVQAGSPAVAPLVQILATPAQAALHPAARDMLLRLQANAIAPLIGVLESSDEKLKIKVVEILGQLGARDAVDHLLVPYLASQSSAELRGAAQQALTQIVDSLPTMAGAQAVLRHDVREQLELARRMAADADGGAVPVEIWQWNAQRKQSEPVAHRVDDAHRVQAAQLARDLYQLDATDPTNRRLFLTAVLEAAKYTGGLEKPLANGEGTAYATAASLGADALDQYLGYALEANHPVAATAAAQVLGDIGDAGLLQHGAPSASPLVRAVKHGDPRLRFTALEAILKFKPSEPFAGSSAVPEALGYFIAATGNHRALVAHPQPMQAQQIAGMLSELGYVTDTAIDSRRAFELATTSPDYDFALIHTALRHPTTEELLVQLRKDPRTARLPIGLLPRLEDTARARHFAERAGLATTFPRPLDVEAAKFDADALVALPGRHLLTPEQRFQQAAVALDGMLEFSERRQSLFDLRRQVWSIQLALYVPAHAAKAALLLGNLGTMQGQGALLELAGSPGQALTARQAAAVAFSRSVDRYGLQLTSEQIVEQYDRYNANAGQNPDTQVVLTSILDTIERKTNPDESDGGKG